MNPRTVLDAIDHIAEARNILNRYLATQSHVVSETDGGYSYPHHVSGRLDKLQLIVGHFSVDDNPLSLLDLLNPSEPPEQEEIDFFINELMEVTYPCPGFPPLKTTTVKCIDDAIDELMEARQILGPSQDLQTEQSIESIEPMQSKVNLTSSFFTNAAIALSQTFFSCAASSSPFEQLEKTKTASVTDLTKQLKR